jgi:hypothetical protein
MLDVFNIVDSFCAKKSKHPLSNAYDDLAMAHMAQEQSAGLSLEDRSEPES